MRLCLGLVLALSVLTTGLGAAGCTELTAPRQSAEQGKAQRSDPNTDQSKDVELLHARCVQDMVRQTCRVMTGPELARLPADAVVFVAGVGAIDAELYAELRGNADGMCQTLRSHCTQAWSGARCRTVRALYSAADQRWMSPTQRYLDLT